MPVNPADLQIVFYPAPVLRQPAEPVGAVDEEARAVAERMIELMHEARGVGLAAPQVGLNWRLFVANWGDGDRVYINPELSEPSRDTDREEEGCLSIPDVRAQIMRPIEITITATNLQGQPFTETSDDLPARVWQHETDHLDGRLILDRMTLIDRKVNRRAIQALEDDYAARGR
jgi:peptide deformylase